LFIARFVPESERWRESVKQHDSQPLREVFSATLRNRTLLGIAFAAIALIGTWGSVQWLPAWADQLTQGKVHNAKALAQMLTGLGAVVGCFVGAGIGGLLGRRPAYFLLCLSALLTCGSLFRAVSNYGVLFLAMVFLVGCTTAAFYGWLPLYLPE